MILIERWISSTAKTTAEMASPTSLVLFSIWSGMLLTLKCRSLSICRVLSSRIPQAASRMTAISSNIIAGARDRGRKTL